MQTVFLVAIMGALGALTRYGVGLLFSAANFPLATLIVNGCGCFLIGWIFASYPKLGLLPLVFVVGYLGALTTFSAYSLETIRLFQRDQAFLGFLNIFLNNTLGLLLCWVGFFLGKGSA